MLKVVRTPSAFLPQTGDDSLAQTPRQELGEIMLSSAVGASFGKGTGRVKERGSKRVARISCIVESWFRWRIWCGKGWRMGKKMKDRWRRRILLDLLPKGCLGGDV